MIKNGKEKFVYCLLHPKRRGPEKQRWRVLAASFTVFKGFSNMAVVDCDYPQYSIAEMRERLVYEWPRTTITSRWHTNSLPGCKRNVPGCKEPT